MLIVKLSIREPSVLVSLGLTGDLIRGLFRGLDSSAPESVSW